MEKLNQIRVGRGLTYESLGELAGYDRTAAWKHCKCTVLPAEAAIRYSAALGVPLSELRPDLPVPFGADSTPTDEARA